MLTFPQGGKKVIYSPRKKTSHLREILRRNPTISSAVPIYMLDGPVQRPAIWNARQNGNHHTRLGRHTGFLVGLNQAKRN
jgi:hypothetical protein